jgi:AbrB family looped-hinge helix DNA binding protein
LQIRGFCFTDTTVSPTSITQTTRSKAADLKIEILATPAREVAWHTIFDLWHFWPLCHNMSYMAKSNPVATRVAAGGRIVIPAAYRKALGIKPGDDVVLQLQSEEIRLYSRKQALRRLQDRVAKAIPRNVSLADELLRERKEEARRG